MNKSLFYFLIISVLSLSIIACNSGEQGDVPCKYGKPSPILAEDVVGVSQYEFTATDSSGRETALITDTLLATSAMRFTLVQSGCEKMKQEFRFELPQTDYTMQPDSFFVQRAAEGLRVLSEKSPSTSQSFIPNFAFELYASAGNVSLNKVLAVDSKTAPGVSFMVNKIVSPHDAIISVEFITE